ncbi:MAG: hypothetical protein U5L01_02980 [Rheinheimera sp.]|nr:hypothetical protein [Rheinheimera sp.]
MNSPSKKNSSRLSALVIGALASQAAVAQGFSAVELSSGYQLPASADPVKTDGKTTVPVSEQKATEHKCGEGKCGEGKCGEGKCGEGKCGEATPTDAKTEIKSTKEAKCGGMI